MKTRALKLLTPCLLLSLTCAVFRADAAAGDLDLSFSPTFGTVDSASYVGFLMQPDGRIIVSGAANDASNAGAIDRVNADGSLDRTFNFRPFATNLFFGPVAVQPDGKVLIRSRQVSGANDVVA